MRDLYAKISARVPGITDGLLEQYRVRALGAAPDIAKFMFVKGHGWEAQSKIERPKLEVVAWNMAFCEIIQVLMESDDDLERRIAALENKQK